MKKQWIYVVSYLFLATGFQFSIAQEVKQKADTEFNERTYTYVERELEYLMTIWEGKYDNVEQLDFDSKAGNNGAHYRVHSVIERIENSSFGDYVVYMESYKNDDPTAIIHQTIYQLQANESNKTIRLIPFHFKDQKPIVALNKKIDFLKDLNSNSPNLQKGCEMQMKREGMAFEASTIDKKCNEVDGKKNSSMDYQIRVAKDSFWFREVQYNSKKEVRLPNGVQLSYFQLKKARCFVCMIDYPNETNGRPTITKYYIPIHDQGGKFEFDYPDRRHMVLGMRNTWSFGMQRETFVIFIQEGSQNGKTLVYSWGNLGADRIGFNPGWIRVQCDLDTPENRKLQKGLRSDS